MGQDSSNTNDDKLDQSSETSNIITDNNENLYPILALGDSITKGYYSGGRKFHPYSITLNQLLELNSTNVYQFGHSGETTDKMKQRLKRIVDKKPNSNDELIHYIEDYYDNIPESEVGPMHLPKSGFKGAIIIGGTNDLAYGFSSETIANNLIEMFEYCFEREVEWVVACSIPSSQYDAATSKSQSLERVLQKKAEVNSIIRSYVLDQQQSNSRKIIFVDFMSELNYCTCSEEEKKLWWDDSLHYTPSGSDRIAEILANHLKKTGWLDGVN